MCGHRHLRRKPLTKSPTEKRLTLNVQSARNSLSQWATNATTAGNLRKSRNNSEDDIVYRNISDLLAEGGGFEPLIGKRIPAPPSNYLAQN